MLQASAHDDFCTWRSLWEAENWPRKLVGGPMVPWYIVCASPQNTSVKSVGHCQLVSSWESSGCVGFPFSALALMWAGILGGRVGESCVRLAEALRIWEVHKKHGNKVVSVMTSHSPRTMMEMSETVVVCTFLFFWNKFWCKSLGRVISKVENLVFYKHETAVLFAEGFTEKLLFLEV